jgi:hypothetical protein
MLESRVKVLPNIEIPKKVTSINKSFILPTSNLAHLIGVNMIGVNHGCRKQSSKYSASVDTSA